MWLVILHPGENEVMILIIKYKAFERNIDVVSERIEEGVNFFDQNSLKCLQV